MSAPADALAWRIGIVCCALLAALNLAAGLSGGLARLGLPVPSAALAHHGAIMVGGFFGVLISLERAVALKRLPGLLAPLAAGLGGLFAWSLPAPDAAQAALLLAAFALLGLYLLAGLTRAWSLHLCVELAGALCWGAGTLAWLQDGTGPAVTGWMGFLLLTIAGERRELTRMLRLPAHAQALFLGAVGAALCAVLMQGLASGGVARIAPAAIAALWWSGCAALALWLLRWDLAPRQWRAEGWRGHTAQNLSIGYLWLLVGALLGLAGLWRPGGATGVALHALLLGFVFLMVFGHAPIILPALARLRPVYTPWARAPLWLLSASLLLRAAGAESGEARWLALAGAGHALAIGAFALVMLLAVLRAPPRR